MNILIFTQQLGFNYGGILQAYALMRVLKSRGHNVAFLDWYTIPGYLWKRPATVSSKKEMHFHGRLYLLVRSIPRRIESRKLLSFAKKTFPKKFVKEWNISLVHGIDAVVVGSDQVWRPRYNGRFLTHAFCDYFSSSQAKKIAYAASFGTDENEFSDEQVEAIRPLLRDFNQISVRERSGVALLGKIFEVSSEHVLDPTLLLDKEDYMRLAHIKPGTKPKGGLLTYILDESDEINALVKRVSKDRGLKTFRCNSEFENPQAPIWKKMQPSVQSWIKAFYDADFVIADSFHASVFSLIFRKPFIIIGNKNRGMSRFSSLFEQFDCLHCLLSSASDYSSSVDYCIDEVRYEQILDEGRKLSLAFLDEAGL